MRGLPPLYLDTSSEACSSTTASSQFLARACVVCVCVCGEAKSPSRCVLCCGREGGGIGKRPTYPPCCVRTCAVPGSVRATNQQPPFFPSTSSSPSSISLSLLLIPYSRLPFAAAAKSSRRRRRRRKKTGAKERLKKEKKCTDTHTQSGQKLEGIFFDSSSSQSSSAIYSAVSFASKFTTGNWMIRIWSK